MKNQATFKLSAYLALFDDIARWDMELRPSLDRDFLRLERIVTSRGISFSMIEMPEACKVFDQALSRGRLWADLLPKSFGAVRNGHRRFLRCLFSLVFDDSGFLRDDADTKAIFFLRSVLLLTKKVEINCDEIAVKAEVDAFRRIDESLYHPSLDWLGDRMPIGPGRLSLCDNLKVTSDMFSTRDHIRPRVLLLADQVAGILISRFPSLDWRDVEPRHGPGAVADFRGLGDKYTFPTWPRKLEGMFPLNYFGLSREDLESSDANVSGLLNEVPVRLLAVPKTLKGPRMIASEPTSHQFIQLGLMKWLRQHMPPPLRNSIDFTKQQLSQLMCREASLNGDMATVDLSAASDRLSCWVVERIFQYNEPLLDALHASRSRWLVNATGVGERYFLKLKKYAPMGNGTTFPVQSIVYAILSMASVLYENGLAPTWSNIIQVSGRIRVFGDDIILPSSAVPTLTLILEQLQLKVNQKKTFWEGHFRESCGMDAYMGVDVTPIYLSALELKATPEGLSSWCDVSKNAARRGLVSLSGWMEDQIPVKTRKLLPRSQVDLGCLTLWTPFEGVVGGRRRYNRLLQRFEVLGISTKASNRLSKRESYGNLLQYFLEAPPADSRWSAGFLIRKRTQLKVCWVPVHS